MANSFHRIRKGISLTPTVLPISGEVGDILCDIADNEIKRWDGLSWVKVGSGSVDTTGLLKADGSVPMTADLDLDANSLTNVSRIEGASSSGAMQNIAFLAYGTTFKESLYGGGGWFEVPRSALTSGDGLKIDDLMTYPWSVNDMGAHNVLVTDIIDNPVNNYILIEVDTTGTGWVFPTNLVLEYYYSNTNYAPIKVMGILRNSSNQPYTTSTYVDSQINSRISNAEKGALMGLLL